MTKIYEFDSIIPEKDQNLLKHYLYSHDFPWYYNRDPTFKGDRSKRGTTFSSNILSSNYRSPNVGLFVPIANICGDRLGFGIPVIFNIRAFLHIKNSKFMFNRRDTLHVDTSDPHVVILYYINDADGPTEIVDENKKIIKRVVPKQGKCIMFDGSLYHRSTHPRKHNRCVINFNLYKTPPPTAIPYY